MLRSATEGTLHEAQHTAVLLSNHRVRIIAAENDDIDWRRVIRHAEAVLWAVFHIVEFDNSGEAAR